VDTAQSLAARVDELMHQAKLDARKPELAAKERGITAATPTANSSTKILLKRIVRLVRPAFPRLAYQRYTHVIPNSRRLR